jgi:hypothetical protein
MNEVRESWHGKLRKNTQVYKDNNKIEIYFNTFFIIIVSKRTIEKLIEQNSTLTRKVDLILEMQTVLEDKVTRLENELLGTQSLIKEQDFVAV